MHSPHHRSHQTLGRPPDDGYLLPPLHCPNQFSLLRCMQLMHAWHMIFFGCPISRCLAGSALWNTLFPPSVFNAFRPDSWVLSFYMA